MSQIQNILVDEAFVALDRQLSGFNFFDVLNLRNAEIRHTRFLAHLLDPLASHGLGDVFLRAFLLQAAALGKLSLDGVKQLEVQDLDLQLARVIPEIPFKNSTPLDEAPSSEANANPKGGQLDIFMQIPLRTRGGRDLVIAIENKIQAQAGVGQLQNYKKWLDAKFKRHKIHCLYLTVQEQDANTGWVHVTYSELVYPALVATQHATAHSASQDVAIFLCHYAQVLRDIVESEAAYATTDALAERLMEKYPRVQEDIKRLIDEWPRLADGAPLKPSWGLYRRYMKTFQFLASFDTDESTQVLRWFTHQWGSGLKERNLQILRDDSNRGYLRFLPIAPDSALAALSKQCGKKRRSDERYPWTSGENGVLFEIRCSADGGRSREGSRRSQTDRSDSVVQYKWCLHVVVGPLEGMNRASLVDRLRCLYRIAWPQTQVRKNQKDRPVIQERVLSEQFYSVMKWNFEAGDYKVLQKKMVSPKFLDFLQQAAVLTEEALAECLAGQA
ncbi:MAG TPA: PD-(D/E)XK nuclease family protein [Noviherbaspirillum sp.]|uniref:PD-(D/E)XK nuclease family protein n=1 Tax=Noviherbaspirillum sp. TaxID=1926288 RepID=UPI002B4AA51F|nr:PD-(D/E)XK nuclease family protein [Noviherbaspirillum sp.]HJV86601.1 PD-(D/E)XK nuclease family protein [Noviherbaspirillum sp.]